MGRVYVEIPDELEKRFRLKVLELYGAKRGALSKAMTEAVKLWLNNKEKSSKTSHL